MTFKGIEFGRPQGDAQNSQAVAGLEESQGEGTGIVQDAKETGKHASRIAIRIRATCRVCVLVLPITFRGPLSSPPSSVCSFVPGAATALPSPGRRMGAAQMSSRCA